MIAGLLAAGRPFYEPDWESEQLMGVVLDGDTGWDEVACVAHRELLRAGPEAARRPGRPPAPPTD